MIKNLKIEFFVIGSARAGTTSLYNYLLQHPDIFLPRVKECNYFSSVESLDSQAYKPPAIDKNYHMKIINSYDTYSDLYSECTKNQIKGDISPSYLWDKGTAQRIYEHNPNSKIVVSLRNPITRAFSHYLMHYNTGYEREETFEKALKAEKRNIWGGGNLYLEIGKYSDQLKRYLEVFNRDQIKILIYESWTNNILHSMNEVYAFLGLDPMKDLLNGEKYNETFYVKNVGLLNVLRSGKQKEIFDLILSENVKTKLKKNFFSTAKNTQTLKASVKNKLIDFYTPEVETLEKLIDVPLKSIWNFND